MLEESRPSQGTSSNRGMWQHMQEPKAKAAAWSPGWSHGKKIFWTSEDILTFVTCRYVYRMSYNSIAKILAVNTQTVIELAERLGTFYIKDNPFGPEPPPARH